MTGDARDGTDDDASVEEDPSADAEIPIEGDGPTDRGTPTEADTREDLTEIRFVGPATAEILTAADVDADDIRSKEVSYRQLVDAGVNPGVATKLRREHSLSWSFGGSPGEDLDRRSAQIRGLQDDERAWVAASTGDWESTSPPSTDTETEADGSGEAEAAEAAWRDRSRPEPVTEIDGIGEAYSERLADAGINSVRSLAAVDPDQVAELLDLAPKRVRDWRDQAEEML